MVSPGISNLKTAKTGLDQAGREGAKEGNLSNLAFFTQHCFGTFERVPGLAFPTVEKLKFNHLRFYQFNEGMYLTYETRWKPPAVFDSFDKPMFSMRGFFSHSCSTTNNVVAYRAHRPRILRL